MFQVKADYLRKVHPAREENIDSTIIQLGKAGERLAKGFLHHNGVEYDEGESFDSLIRKLQAIETPPNIVVGLRTILKYRNQAAHDSHVVLNIHDLDAAVSAFSASYMGLCSIVEHPAPLIHGSSNDRSLENVTVPEFRPRDDTLGKFRKNIRPICFFTAGMLLVAVIFGGSYNFFLILRITVTLSSIILAVLNGRRRIFLAVLFIGVALLFNPMYPVRLDREIWKPIDLAVGVLFLLAGLRYGKG